MKISALIRNLWREVEDILTAATGPLLIVSSAISTSDIFSNSTFSHLIPQLPAIWAIGRALAVTMWLGIAFEYFLDAQRSHNSTPAFWWFALSIVLFAVDLQTATLFAFQAEHISSLGEWSILQIPPIDWAIEQATLGVILIAVHRAVIHTASSTVAVTPATFARPNVQQDSSAVMRRDVPRAAPVARRAYYAGPVAPLASEDAYEDEDGGGVIELVSDEEPEQPPTRAGVTRHTTRKPRSDRGRVSIEPQARVQLLLAEMRRRGRVLTINESVAFLEEHGMGVSRGTAVADRTNARRIYLSEKTV